ncbi:HAMP domain-containing sensor histidine kinase [Gallaecimonas kandeliae]|uniref:sensor histidine kinase n=1 Tax=Gallaecimonas kandeliae TaxID=3029055 RepID=UPI0026475858|nr:HAMP domain-containing sensor histidine kinase [Gallaecimonas kandeliae]WKE65847.1 HAMP domain-containing sensor histidine kinase [Gallaecimonas kandeliae]
MKLRCKLKSPLVRYYLALVLTVLLLSFSLNEVHAWLTIEQAPQVNAKEVLTAVQQRRERGERLGCSADSDPDCNKALFVRYPSGYWGGQPLGEPGAVIPLHDNKGNSLLCHIDHQGGLLCLNQLNWPKHEEPALDFAYIFYLVLLLGLFFVSRGIFRDIETLRASAIKEIRFGKFPRFTLSRRSYLAPLAQSLHNLTGRIAQLNRFQAEVAETVCHDIKTPLARMRFLCQMLEDYPPEELERMLEQNIKEIEANVYDYLRLAQNDYNPQEPSRQRLQLRSYLESVIRPFTELGDKPIQLCVDHDSPFVADATLLTRALNNLLANALRFAHSQVRVEASLSQQELVIQVIDDGPGWQEEEEEQAESQDNIAHHGIGLAIVRRVAEQHRGRLQMARDGAAGTRASLYLPQGQQQGASQNATTG